MNVDIGSQVGGFFVFQNFGDFMVRVVDAAIIMGGILVFFYLILGGFEYLTSGGDKAKTEEAQKKITSAIVGLGILVTAYVIYKIVLQFFGLTEFIQLPG